MNVEIEKRKLDLDFPEMKKRLELHKNSVVTMTYINKQKRKTLVKIKGTVTLVSDKLFCIRIDEDKSYPKELSFTYAELKTGEVQIDEIF